MIDKKLIKWGESGSIIREINEYAIKLAFKVGKENVFNFTIGNPSVDPPLCVQKCINRLNQEFSQNELHAYAPAPGLLSVRKKIADYLTRSFGVNYNFDGIYITSGASSALAILCRALLSSGDQAVVFAPFFPEYKAYIEAVGAKLIVVQPKDASFNLDLDKFDMSITEKTSVVILNSPNNPSGYIVSEQVICDLAQILERKQKEYCHPIYIIADEPYRELSYGKNVPFIPKFYKNTIYCYSFSKSMSLPGDRLGFFAILPTMDSHNEIWAASCGAARIMGYICVSPLMQMVISECIGATSDFSVYKENRELLCDALQNMGFRFPNSDGTFYLFLDTFNSDSRTFCANAMRYNILLVPGIEFGLENYARLSYCVSKQVIEKSLPSFRKLAQLYHLN